MCAYLVSPFVSKRTDLSLMYVFFPLPGITVLQHLQYKML